MSKKHRRTPAPATSAAPAAAAPAVPPLPEPRGALARGFHALALAVLVALSFALYSPSLDDRYVWDDQALVLDNQDLRQSDVAGIFRHTLGQWGGFQSDAYRPIQVLTHLIDRLLFGEGPAGAHASSILWHALAAFAVYLLWSTLSGRKAPALAAAVLFAAHPAAVESVAYISGRADTLSLLWCALSVASYVAASRRAGVLSMMLYTVSSLAMALSALSKEAGLMTPLLCLVSAWLLCGRPLGSQIVRAAAVHASPLIVYALLRSGITTDPAPAAQALALSERLLYLPKVLWDYTMLTLVPSASNLHMEYLFGPYRRAVREPGYFLFFVYAGLLSWVLWRVWSRSGPAVRAALVWTALALSPVLNLYVKINAPIAAHWLYAPLAGLCFAAVAGLEKLCGRLPAQAARRVMIVALAVPTLYLWAQTGSYAGVWSDDISLYRYTAERVPGSFRAANNLCVALQKERRYAEALACFEQLKTETSNPTVDHNLEALRQEMAASGVR